MTREHWGTVQQPILFPPIYMMERFARCHDVVVMDLCKYDRDNSQFTLMGQKGPLQQTVQLAHAPHSATFAERTVIYPQLWAKKLLATVQTNYGRQPHYKEMADWFRTTVGIMAEITDLPSFSTASVLALRRLLRMDTSFRLGSILVPNRPEEPTAWLVSFCNQLQITDYEQGERSMRDYFVKGPFEDAGIRTWGQDFSLEYESNNGRVGHAGLSILDLLFTQGVETTRRLLKIDKGPGLHGTAVLVTR